MIEEAMFPIIISLLVLGCSPAKQESSGEPLSPPASLPHITHDGIDYPYIRYAESTGLRASRGRAIFLHPIKARKTEILTLEYAPGMKVEDLFGQELFGRSGEVVHAAGIIKITSLPISIPVKPTLVRQWRMTHGKYKYLCRFVRETISGKDKITSTSCANDQHSITFVFNDRLGVIEFQDFCDDFVCSYKLIESQGILSRAMLRSMNLIGI
jgi:hypothetical protein